MMFWIPGIASVALVVFLSAIGRLRRPAVVAAWSVTGVVLQLVAGRFSPLWLAGLLISVGVAVYLSIELKLS